MEKQSTTLIKVVAVIALVVVVMLTFTSAGATPRAFPPGTYSVTIVAEDVPPFFPPEAVPIFVGQWVNELTPDGDVIVYKDGDMVAVARYVANPARFVTTDLFGPLSCTTVPGEATGVYKWMFDDELTLEAVHDRCLGRQFVLTVHPWQKQD